MQPAFADAREVRHRNGLGNAFVFDQASQTFAGTFRIRRNDHRPRTKPCFNVRHQGTEKADTFLLSLWREIAPNAPARVNDAQAHGLRQRRKAKHTATCDSRFPCRIIQIQPVGRRWLINTIHPALLGQG